MDEQKLIIQCLLCNEFFRIGDIGPSHILSIRTGEIKFDSIIELPICLNPLCLYLAAKINRTRWGEYIMFYSSFSNEAAEAMLWL